MSVPPVVASTRNTRARPIPEMTEPINVVIKTFECKIFGTKAEHTDMVIEEMTVAYTVPRKNLRPKTTAPINRMGMLRIRNSAAVLI